MGFFRKQWERFKAKSIWGKLSDVLFIALLAMLISSNGRVFLQRVVLETGLFGSFYENTHDEITEQNWNFQMTDRSGEVVFLEDFKGKTIFLNFWATWCPPCNAEIPSMIRLMESCTDDHVVFLLVTRETPDRVEPYLQKKGWDIPVYYAHALPMNELNYSSLPTTFVIDQELNLVHRSTGARKWDDEDTQEYFGCTL